MVNASGYGANLLLNIGPLPNGEIQSAFTERLDSVGAWLIQNGYSIYGSQAGYMKPQSWGAITQRGNTIWLHLFKIDDEMFLVKMPYQVKSAQLAGRSLKVQTLADQYLLINLKGIPLDPVDAIVQLEVIK